MTPYYQRSGVTLWCGDVVDVLGELPAGSVQCVMTSPPYWGLRDYGVAPTAWPAVTFVPVAGLPPLTVPAETCCLGLEADPWAFVGHLVAVFRAVWRVLRADGTCWVNLGDIYATGAGKVGACPGGGKRGERWRGGHEGKHGPVGPMQQPNRLPIEGLKPKDMCGLPWQVAKALQADGWYLRRDVIWHKEQPMPESITDRPTTAHEYVFLLAKAERYFYDAVAVREPSSGNAHGRGKGGTPKAVSQSSAFRAVRDAGHHDCGRVKNNRSFSAAVTGTASTRHCRSVWALGSQPFSEAHYATFPEKLVERPILAGTSAVGCCPRCGAPWRRVTAKKGGDGMKPRGWQTGHGAHDAVPKGYYDNRETGSAKAVPGGKLCPQDDQFGQRRMMDNTKTARAAGGEHDNPFPEPVTVAWAMTCKCGYAPPVPCVVMDPFNGSGTTGVVARRLGRGYVGVELLEANCAMTLRRWQVGGLEVVPAEPESGLLFEVASGEGGNHGNDGVKQ